MWRVSGVSDKVLPSNRCLLYYSFINPYICFMWLPIFVLYLTIKKKKKSLLRSHPEDVINVQRFPRLPEIVIQCCLNEAPQTATLKKLPDVFMQSSADAF